MLGESGYGKPNTVTGEQPEMLHWFELTRRGARRWLEIKRIWRLHIIKQITGDGYFLIASDLAIRKICKDDGITSRTWDAGNDEVKYLGCRRRYTEIGVASNVYMKLFRGITEDLVEYPTICVLITSTFDVQLTGQTNLTSGRVTAVIINTAVYQSPISTFVIIKIWRDGKGRMF